MGELADRYERDGYVQLEGFVGVDDVISLRRALEAAAATSPDENDLSLDGMRFLSNVYRHVHEAVEVVTSDPVVELLRRLGLPDCWLRWDQAVWKRPGAPPFPWHQDNGYTKLSVAHVQLWIALTDAAPDNGGLVVCPGGHRDLLAHRDVGSHVVADPPGPTVALSAAAGDAVVFSSLLPHATGVNRTGDERLVYVAEFLALEDVDESIPSPHLVVAVGGRASGEWLS